ncbi:SusC/RagA family TonB-linked outer membrane protein [Pedobacter deserti]|uniref:SusC/RagA family TonB-linked outer membrane protein n=1 Tax=Pedobacter deserti TaxID=2817382 RepID=UPI00210B771F|nr:SusC/RagA family TonB-linked outer membrane protein [Pedobacter sp. SYSU D00382]
MKFYIKSLYRPKAGMAKILLVMKLIIVLLTTAILQVSASSYGQNVTLKRDNTELVKIFTELRKQTGYDFFYSDQMMEDAIPVTLHLKNVPIEKALELCFKDQPLSYTINNKIVTIKAKEKSLFDRIAERLRAVDIYGRVTDETGAPLVGASVKVKNKNQATKTDARGEFTLKNVDENATLVVSYVGYQEQEVSSITKSNDLVIQLQPSVAGLEEIQVTFNTGYQQIKPEQSTGSISVINRKEYDSRINTTDFLTGLQNKIPGLLINNDVKFENNGLFQIRGISTIKGNRNPLIVVDGYPTEMSLDMIDPNEIESVTVLRDAAAATIYGARSSNGVIIIERKKAKAGKVQVNFRATSSLTPKENYERYRWDENASATVIDFEKLRNASAGPTLWTTLQGPQGGYYNYNLPTLIMAQWRSSTNSITLEERDRQLAELAAYNNSGDYGRLFLRNATTQTYNIDLSGGNNNVLYYLTANYSKNNLTKLNNDNGIFRLSGRSTIKLSDRLQLELNMDLQENKIQAAPIPDINNIYPYEHFQDAQGNPAAMYNTSIPRAKGNKYYHQYIQTLGLLDNAYYPLTEMNEVADRTKTISDRITANLRYNMGNGFNLSVGGVHENAQGTIRHLASENSAEVRQYVNYYTRSGPNGLIYNLPKGAFLRQGTTGTESITARAQANYDKEINADHSVNLILGAEVRKVINQSNTASYFGYNDQTLNNQQVDFKTLINYSASFANSNTPLSYSTLFNHGYADDRFISGYSNLVYAYKSKYSVTGSIRVDQSNLFGTDPKYKYKPLWSVGAAWNVHKENFMQNLEWINSLRLRVAHGFNGNVAKDALPQVIAKDDLNTLNPGGAVPMLNLLSHANSGLRWEQSRNFNLGLNYGLFKGISGSIDYYVKTSTDILANNQIDASKGGVSALINQASIRNHGLEFSLQADWITRKRFNWNTGLVFARNTNKILQVYNPNITPTSAAGFYVSGNYADYIKGYPVGALFNYRYAGLNNTGYAQMYNKSGEVINYSDNTAMIDAAVDLAGSAIPVFNLGMSNRVDVGSFYAYCMINYFSGFSVRVPVPDATTVRPLEGAQNYWKQPGDENNPDAVPILSNTMGYSHYYAIATSDKYTVNGAYITIGDITAAYSFRHSKLVQRAGLSNVELRLQASNVYTKAFNKYNYSLATGSYAKSYLTPTYSAALSINF